MKDLFNYDECIAKDELSKYDEPWKIVPHISEIVNETIKKLNKNSSNTSKTTLPNTSKPCNPFTRHPTPILHHQLSNLLIFISFYIFL